MRARLSIALLVLAAACAPTAANAQETKDSATIAAQFFRAARAAYDRGEFRAAALAFLEAYRRVPKAAAIYDAGRAWEAAGENELAADAFARALQGDLAAEDHDYARAHLAVLAAPLGVVAVHAPAGATASVQGVDRGVIPASIYLAPGSHEIHALRRDGSDVVRVVVIRAAGEKVDISFPDVEPPKREKPLAPRQIVTTRSSPVGAWISLGAAAALGIGGAVTYDAFANARSDFETSGGRDAVSHDDAQKWRTWTYALWGGAIAFGALGGVLLITTAASHSQTTASLGLTPSGVSFSITR